MVRQVIHRTTYEWSNSKICRTFLSIVILKTSRTFISFCYLLSSYTYLLHLFIFSLIFFQKANSIYTPFGPLRIVCQLCGRTKRFHPWKKLPSISIIQQLKFKTSLRHLRMERHDLSLFQYFSIDAILVMSKILGLQMITIVIDLKRM